MDRIAWLETKLRELESRNHVTDVSHEPLETQPVLPQPLVQSPNKTSANDCTDQISITAALFSIPRHVDAKSTPLLTGIIDRGLYDQPQPPRSTWESNKNRAVLAMDQRIQQLEEALAKQPASTPPPHLPQAQAPCYQAAEFNPPAASIYSSAFSGRPVTYYPSTTDDKPGQPDVRPHVNQHPIAKFAPALSSGLKDQGSGTSKPALLSTSSLKAPTTALPWGTWEMQKSAALLALESEKRALETAIEQQHKAMAQHEKQLGDLHEEHRLALHNMATSHQKVLRDAAGIAGKKLERMYSEAWQLFRRRTLQTLRARTFTGWRRYAAQCRKLRWAERVWVRRSLEACFLEWAVVTTAMRQQREAEMQAKDLKQKQLDQEAARLESLERKCTTLHVRAVFAAWRDTVHALQAKHEQQARAVRHRSRTLLRAGWLGLGQAVREDIADAVILEIKLDRVRLRFVFRAWVQDHRLLHLHLRHLQLQVLKSWRGHTMYKVAVHGRVMGWQLQWRLRHLDAVMSEWQRRADYLRRLKAVADAVRTTHRRAIYKHCLSQLMRTARHAAAVRMMAARRLRGVLQMWQTVVQRRARNARLVAARNAVRWAPVLAQAFSLWRVFGSTRRSRLQMQDITALQGYTNELQQLCEVARHERSEALQAADALKDENAGLRVEAQRNLLLAAPSGLLHHPLSWQSLPPDLDKWQPAGRGRHAALWLPGIQEDHTAAVAPVPLVSSHYAQPAVLSSSVVMYGGVSGDDWFNDISIVTIKLTDGASVCAEWCRPVVDPAGSNPPLPRRRDFSSCACGPNMLLVSGGFDGSQELSSTHLFTVRRVDNDLHAAPAPGDAAPGQSTTFSVSWQLLEPRNRTPAARSHHVAVYDEQRRAVYMFGGYNSSQSHLNELWTFSMDNMEWWQPETTGDPPPPRRGHAAGVIGSCLYVFGGYDGARHLDDLWQLDLGTWHWTRLQAQGPIPSARRGHAVDIIAERFLVLHGGFDGSKQCGDTFTYDTVTRMWTRLQVEGDAANMPAPRCMHTLTCVGHACVLLGGVGSLGTLRDIHLLTSPGVTQGMLQQNKLLASQQSLAELRGRCAQLQAQLSSAQDMYAEAQRQRQVVSARASELAQQYNECCEAVQQLKGALLAAQKQLVDEHHAQQQEALHAAALQRKLDRARKGGSLAAEAAEGIHTQLQAAHLHISKLEAELTEAVRAAHDAQAVVLQLTGERQALATQLAASSNESTMLRHMSAVAEAELRAAAARGMTVAEAEVDRLKAELMACKAREQEALTKLAEAEAMAEEDSIEYPALSSSRLPSALQAPARSRSSTAPGGTEPLPPASGLPRAHEAGAAAGPAPAAVYQPVELITAQARAQTAETQLDMLQQEYARVTAELAAAKHEASKERAAHQAAKATLETAAMDKQMMEMRYQHAMQQLEDEVRQLHRNKWRGEVPGPEPGPGQAGGPMLPRHVTGHNAQHPVMQLPAAGSVTQLSSGGPVLVMQDTGGQQVQVQVPVHYFHELQLGHAVAASTAYQQAAHGATQQQQQSRAATNVGRALQYDTAVPRLSSHEAAYLMVSPAAPGPSVSDELQGLMSAQAAPSHASQAMSGMGYDGTNVTVLRDLHVVQQDATAPRMTWEEEWQRVHPHVAELQPMADQGTHGEGSPVPHDDYVPSDDAGLGVLPEVAELMRLHRELI